MGDRDEILSDLYELWVEAHVLEGNDPNCEGSLELGATPTTGVEALSGNTSSETESGIDLSPQPIEGPVGGPTGREPREGSGNGQVAATRDDVATVTSCDPEPVEATWDDVATGTSFDPERFWKLLRAAGYETS